MYCLQIPSNCVSIYDQPTLNVPTYDLHTNVLYSYVQFKLVGNYTLIKLRNLI